MFLMQLRLNICIFNIIIFDTTLSEMIIYSFLSLSEVSKIRECSHSHKMRMLFSTAVLLFWSDNFMECNFPGTRKIIHITAR